VDRVGIIDLGSNTFHLLVVDIDKEGQFTTIFKDRSFVGLAEDGLQQISQKAIDKGLETLKNFKSILDQYGVRQYKVIGTAALRSAENRAVFLNQIRESLGFQVEVIAGKREADLIFKGVSLLHSMQGDHLIMDIGGGSVEFIFVQDGKNTWSKSYNIGVGVLHSQFHNSEPISDKEIQALAGFLKNELQEFSRKAQGLEIENLIGASGSFEVVESMNGKSIAPHQTSAVSLEEYKRVSKQLQAANYEERSQMPGLPPSRVKLIVVAMILIDVVIEIVNPRKVLISPYALKEGLLSELKV